MSNFLSNIINRHSQNANLVRPRGVGVFETHRFWSEAAPSVAEVHSVDSQTNVSPSMDSVIKPAVHQNNSNEPTANRLSNKPKNPIRREKQQPIDLFDKKKQQSKEHIIEKLNFKTKIQAAKITDSDKGEVIFKKNNSPEDVIDKLQNRIAVIKANHKFSNFDSRPVDKHMNKGIMEEQMLTRPHKEIKQQLTSNFNRNTKALGEPSSYNKSDNAGPSGNSTPTVKIHIGRIDIKAVKQNTQTVHNNKKASKQGMSLEQFLNKRSAK